MARFNDVPPEIRQKILLPVIVDGERTYYFGAALPWHIPENQTMVEEEAFFLKNIHIVDGRYSALDLAMVCSTWRNDIITVLQEFLRKFEHKLRDLGKNSPVCELLHDLSECIC